MKFLSPLIVSLAIFFISCDKEDPQSQFQIDLDLIEEYVADNNLTTQVTASGLHYVIQQEGTGNLPTTDSVVTVTYRGEFLDGRVFDEATNPIDFNLNGVINGWQEGLQLIKEGGRISLVLPSELAYGTRGAGSIPPNTVLFFEVDLIEVSQP